MSGQEPMVRLDQFEKWYGVIHAVKNLDLDVPRGEAFVLLGSNGSGKSTILRAVAGLHAPSSGRVIVEGVDVAVDPLAARGRIAFLPQRVVLPELLTGREVLSFYAGLKGVDQRRVGEVIELIGLAEDADRYAREYSGGMVQRLGLGITFLRDVPLYLLDEPTLNLDPSGVDQFRRWLEDRVAAGSTVLFTSHILQEALRLADRVAVMAEGELVKVEEVSGFRNRVVAATTVSVVVDELTEKMIEAAQKAGADEASWNDRSYSFKASPEKRQGVIRAIEKSGGFIEELHTEPPDWESLAQLFSEP
jgi:ABC-2 type transport system ATP-binding protein